MNGAVRILRRFVGSTMLVSVLLLLFNLVLLGVIVFKEVQEGPSPSAVVRQVSAGLTAEGAGEYRLDVEAQRLLERHQAWVMLLDEQGQVNWSMSLPPEIPRSYNVIDVAKFARYYLMEYPVYVWERSEGLLVMGYPKHTYGKYQLDLLADWLRSLPLRILLLLLCNIALALVVSVLIGTRLIRSIRPLIEGMHTLARGQPVQLVSGGILQDLSTSINSTSRMLQDKDEALKARDEARSNWIAGISHDIRTPLSMILGYASELEERAELTADARQQAAIIRRQGERLRSLVSDLNLVSMLEYDMQPLQLKPIRPSVLARQVVSDFLNDGLDERYAISLQVEEESVATMGDERLLYRALTNLIHNSLRHNPEGCAIEVRTGRTPGGEECYIEVSDDGRGIARADLADVVLLPYAAGRKRHAGQGHGLGLPMVARIARAHRGELLLGSDEGQGLRAVMKLPVN
ncbi:two-component sensor histidine kinase [Paenibacillus sp. 598K]|uniref:sensor histidine kinase n=1 Tax=Paenibacillus sp. 598K TaxID=1117987 RepID=UPI000FF93E0C|nr:HAMP domain-containing sensor histidine kinase [Paenibacillus sp. 598K]GBF76450.1 two-component sensor histidine kinase [Paenibacillus sp. 598K]